MAQPQQHTPIEQVLELLVEQGTDGLLRELIFNVGQPAYNNP